MDDMCTPVAAPIVGMAINAASMAANAGDTADAAAGARDEARHLAARGVREAKLVRQKNAQARAQHRVAMAKAGVTDAGSPTDTLLDLAASGERDARWAQLGYDEEAREKLRDARRVRRKGLLTQLDGAAGLSDQVIKLSDAIS
jgi:hypothetical protein